MKGLGISKFHVVLMFILIALAISLCYNYRKKYLFYALGSFLALTIFDFGHTLYLATQKQVIVYSLGKTTAIEFINGQSDILLASNNLLENPKAMRFNIEPVRIQRNISSASNLPLKNDTLALGISFYKKEGFIKYNDISLLVLSHKTSVKKASKPLFQRINALVICNKAQVDIKRLKTKLNFDLVIIDASNTFYQAKSLSETCKKLGIKHLNLSETGAYILDVE